MQRLIPIRAAWAYWRGAVLPVVAGRWKSRAARMRPLASTRRVSAGCDRGGSCATQVPCPKTIVLHSGAVQTLSIDESMSERSRDRLASITQLTLYPCRRLRTVHSVSSLVRRSAAGMSDGSTQ